jgi:7 transmembrane helices usually fused to an inactive transglutaminase
MNRYIFLFILSIFHSSLYAAATGEIIDSLPTFCTEQFQIAWSEQVQVGSTHEYRVTTGSGLDFSGSIIYTLVRDGSTVEVVSDREKYLRYFTTPGEVNLQVRIEFPEFSCGINISKTIRVYQSSIFFVWQKRKWIEFGMIDVLDKNNIQFLDYPDNSYISQSEHSQEIWSSIDQSDIFIVANPDLLWFFSDVAKLQKGKSINFTQKQIYIITDFSRSFLSKVLASSLSQIGATRVYIISEDQLYGLMTRISVGESDIGSIGQELSYEKFRTVYSLSRFFEFLAYAGFSYELFAFLLSLTFVVLILNILKQIVGFNVFGIYYPILFAITISSLGLSAFIFIVIGTLSIIVVNLFSKKVHLLLHAKRSLLISLYIVLFLFTLGIDNFFELSLINYTIFDNPLIIFPLFITVILADKVFQEDIDMFRRSGAIDIIQYALVTLIIYGLFEYQALQYFLISYPDTIILVVFLNILVGRYMGLQLFEYFRFSPLLKKLNEEE